MRPRRKLLLLLATFLFILLLAQHVRNRQAKGLPLSHWFNPRERPDVLTTTTWHAPVIWEGTFNRWALESYYKRRNITVGLAVFAVDRFLDKYLKRFLESADKHFMVGHKVIFYITVDDLFRVPDINFGPQRTFRIFKLDSEDKAWSHDLHLVHMRTLRSRIPSHMQKEVDFLFSMAANQVFQGDFGVEALGRSVAQLHPWWYFRSTETPPYERRPGSAACIPFGEGDFYYSSSAMGGTPRELLQFASHYLQNTARDSSNRVHSSFESHLNKYFFLHKPSTLLSPEYAWDPRLRLPPQMRRVKVACFSERD